MLHDMQLSFKYILIVKWFMKFVSKVKNDVFENEQLILFVITWC